MNKVKVRVNYALKAATGQQQVEAAAHRARRVHMENITGTKVARPMSARIVTLVNILLLRVQRVMQHAKIVRRVDSKVVQVNYHAQLAL